MAFRYHIMELMDYARKLRKNRAYRADAARYLKSELKPKLDLELWTPLDDHYKRKKYLSCLHGRKVLIKFYRHKASRFARQHHDLYEVLREAGIRVPEILHIDTREQTIKNYGMACIGMAWIEGDPLTCDSLHAASCRQALQELARLHMIRYEIPENTEGYPTYSLKLDQLDSIRSMDIIRKSIGWIGHHVDVSGGGQVLEVLSQAIENVFDHDHSTGILHLDYRKENLLVTSDRELYVLDYEEACLGPPGFDLATALLHFRFGLESDELTAMNLEQVIEPKTFLAWTRPYFDVAGGVVESEWDQYAKTFLMWAYVKFVGHLAKRSFNLFIYYRISLKKCLKQAEVRWSNLMEFLGEGARPIASVFRKE